MPTPLRRQVIEDELKRRIRSGAYPPGSRIPPRTALLAELPASPVTMQRALDRLILQGYVVARGSHGTFVAEHLPDRARFAVVFAAEEGRHPWNRFWSTALREALAWRDEAGHGFRPYFVADGRAEAEGHRQLCADVADGLLAGILFVSPPRYLGPSPVLSATVPRVLFSPAAEDTERFGATVVDWSEGVGLNERMCRIFAAEGRHRLAGLLPLGHGERWRECAQLAERAGLATRASWWVGLPTDPRMAEVARHVVHLLLDRPAAERPDALFIGDDNLVHHATSGVLAAGLRVPQDLGIFAHANLPSPTPSAVPCRRFGPDMRCLLTATVAELERLRAGGRTRMVRVEQGFQDEAGAG